MRGGGIKFVLTLVAAGLLSAMTARAALSLGPPQPAQPAAGLAEVFFTAAATNTDAVNELFLNNVQITFTGGAEVYLTADTNVFFGDVPGLLPGAAAYNDVAFGILVSPATPPGQYAGTVTFQGGTNIYAATTLGSLAFTVNLTPAALTIAAATNGPALSWPVPPGGFQLQSSPSLSPTNWTTVTNPLTTNGGTNSVSLSAGVSNQFFRLAYP